MDWLLGILTVTVVFRPFRLFDSSVLLGFLCTVDVHYLIGYTLGPCLFSTPLLFLLYLFDIRNQLLLHTYDQVVDIVCMFIILQLLFPLTRPSLHIPLRDIISELQKYSNFDKNFYSYNHFLVQKLI